MVDGQVRPALLPPDRRRVSSRSGNGVVIDLSVLFDEIEQLRARDRHVQLSDERQRT